MFTQSAQQIKYTTLQKVNSHKTSFKHVICIAIDAFGTLPVYTRDRYSHFCTDARHLPRTASTPQCLIMWTVKSPIVNHVTNKTNILQTLSRSCAHISPALGVPVWNQCSFLLHCDDSQTL